MQRYYGTHGTTAAEYFSAGAKIPKVPVENSPPPDVLHRSLLHMEEVPTLVKAARRGRTQRTATTRDGHPSDQRTHRLGPQDHPEVPTTTKQGAGARPAAAASQPARATDQLPTDSPFSRLCSAETLVKARDIISRALPARFTLTPHLRDEGSVANVSAQTSRGIGSPAVSIFCRFSLFIT